MDRPGPYYIKRNTKQLLVDGQIVEPSMRPRYQSENRGSEAENQNKEQRVLKQPTEISLDYLQLISKASFQPQSPLIGTANRILNFPINHVQNSNSVHEDYNTNSPRKDDHFRDSHIINRKENPISFLSRSHIIPNHQPYLQRSNAIQKKEIKMMAYSKERKIQSQAASIMSSLIKMQLSNIQNQKSGIQKKQDVTSETQDKPLLNIISATIQQKPNFQLAPLFNQKQNAYRNHRREYLCQFQLVKQDVRQEYYNALKGQSLKCLWRKDKKSLNQELINKCIIIHFEEVLQKGSRNFWKGSIQNGDVQICNSNNIQNQCDSYLCLCTLRANCKALLKGLTQIGLVYMVYSNKLIAQKWDGFFRKNQYLYDGSYYSRNNTYSQSKLKPAGIKYQQIFNDIQFHPKNIVIINSLSNDYFERSQVWNIRDQTNLADDFEYFQTRIPLIDLTNIEFQASVFYLNSNSAMDASIIQDVVYSSLQNSNTISSKISLNISQISLEKTKDGIHQGLVSRAYVSLKKKQYYEDNTVLEDKEKDEWLQQVSIFKQNILDEIKEKMSHKVFNLHYMIGDIITRNNSLFRHVKCSKFFQKNPGLFVQNLVEKQSDLEMDSYLAQLSSENQNRQSSIQYFIFQESKAEYQKQN